MEIERNYHPIHPMQTTFRVAIEKGTLIAASTIQRKPSYFEWSIVTDPMDIYGPKDYTTSSDDQNLVADSESMENIDNDENEPDRIDSLEDNGRALEDEEIHHSPPPINLNLLQGAHLIEGYEYTPFNPSNYNNNLSGTNAYMRISQDNAIKALDGLKNVLRPHRDTGRGYKKPELDLWHRARIEGMCSMLYMFTNQESHTYNKWGASACQAAIGLGWGRHCARRLCELNRAYFADQTVLPINPYGDWNESLLVEDNIVNEINIYLLSLGNDISASKLVDFLHRQEIKDKYGIERNISHKTAC